MCSCGILRVISAAPLPSSTLISILNPSHPECCPLWADPGTSVSPSKDGDELWGVTLHQMLMLSVLKIAWTSHMRSCKHKDIRLWNLESAKSLSPPPALCLNLSLFSISYPWFVFMCIMEQMPKSPNSLGCFEETAASGSLGINTSSLHVWPFTCCLLFGTFDLDLACVSSFLKQRLWPYPLTESLCPSCWYRLICFLFCRWVWSQHTDILKLPHDPLKVV